jgi:AcrR family transcriptional regulator
MVTQRQEGLPTVRDLRMSRTSIEASVAITPPLSRRQRKRDSTRQVIFETAIRMFSEKGFDAPTIDQIAAAADIGKGTFYNYFDSKEEILVAFMVEVEARIGKRLARFSEASGPLETILCDYVRYQFRLKRPYYAFVQVFLATLMRRGPQMMDHIIRMQEYVDPPLYTLFTRLKERKLIKATANLEELVYTFKCIHLGASCLWAMSGPSFQPAMDAFALQVAPFARSIEKRNS